MSYEQELIKIVFIIFVFIFPNSVIIDSWSEESSNFFLLGSLSKIIKNSAPKAGRLPLIMTARYGEIMVSGIENLTGKARTTSIFKISSDWGLCESVPPLCCLPATAD